MKPTKDIVNHVNNMRDKIQEMLDECAKELGVIPKFEQLLNYDAGDVFPKGSIVNLCEVIVAGVESESI